MRCDISTIDACSMQCDRKHLPGCHVLPTPGLSREKGSESDISIALIGWLWFYKSVRDMFERSGGALVDMEKWDIRVDVFTQGRGVMECHGVSWAGIEGGGWKRKGPMFEEVRLLAMSAHLDTPGVEYIYLCRLALELDI